MERYFPMFKHVKGFLYKDISDSLSKAIQHLKTCEYTPFCNFIEVGTKYYEYDSVSDNVLMRCRDEICRNMYDKKPLTSMSYGGGQHDSTGYL
ncbi:hypothetical protein PEC301879_22330 [Pectobacterium carotovorum subsp. carotovorum]|nr:hypothetical protein PEC301879_22330 [Pectobacterium carotovorum subsp. carotovorum]